MPQVLALLFTCPVILKLYMSNKTLLYISAVLGLGGGLPDIARAQEPALPGWQVGAGVGNGVCVFGGVSWPRAVALLRGRYLWRGPNQEPFRHKLIQHLDTRSRQVEGAALLGYPMQLGRGTLQVASGLALVGGRLLTDYRFSKVSSGFISSSTHYFAYRRYVAVGLPLELSWQNKPLQREDGTLGISVQANLNPQHSTLCVLLTFTAGRTSPPATKLL